MDRSPAHPEQSSPGRAVAVLIGAPTGLLGGLIGLGGAEFRLPPLIALFHYSPRNAVRVNLSISLLTVSSALLVRSLGPTITTPLALILPTLVLAGGGMLGASFGVRWLRAASDSVLRYTLLVLLSAIGLLLLAEGFFGLSPVPLVAQPAYVAAVALLLGIAIGSVSSLLGVAGGELIIPALVLVFGADIKTAGTCSLAISLPTMLVGLRKHRVLAAPLGLTQFEAATVIWVGLASVLGAALGGLLVPYVHARALKVLLGVLLVWSARKALHH